MANSNDQNDKKQDSAWGAASINPLAKAMGANKPIKPVQAKPEKPVKPAKEKPVREPKPAKEPREKPTREASSPKEKPVKEPRTGLFGRKPKPENQPSEPTPDSYGFTGGESGGDSGFDFGNNGSFGQNRPEPVAFPSMTEPKKDLGSMLNVLEEASSGEPDMDAVRRAANGEAPLVPSITTPSLPAPIPAPVKSEPTPIASEPILPPVVLPPIVISAPVISGPVVASEPIASVPIPSEPFIPIPEPTIAEPFVFTPVSSEPVMEEGKTASEPLAPIASEPIPFPSEPALPPVISTPVIPVPVVVPISSEPTSSPLPVATSSEPLFSSSPENPQASEPKMFPTRNVDFSVLDEETSSEPKLPPMPEHLREENITPEKHGRVKNPKRIKASTIPESDELTEQKLPRTVKPVREKPVRKPKVVKEPKQALPKEPKTKPVKEKVTKERVIKEKPIKTPQANLAGEQQSVFSFLKANKGISWAIVAVIVIIAIVIAVPVILSKGVGNNTADPTPTPTSTETQVPAGTPIAPEDSNNYKAATDPNGLYFLTLGQWVGPANVTQAKAPAPYFTLALYTMYNYVSNSYANPYYYTGRWAKNDKYTFGALQEYQDPFFTPELQASLQQGYTNATGMDTTNNDKANTALLSFIKDYVYVPDTTLTGQNGVVFTCVQNWVPPMALSPDCLPDEFAFGTHNGFQITNSNITDTTTDPDKPTMTIEFDIRMAVLYQDPILSNGSTFTEYRDYKISADLVGSVPTTTTGDDYVMKINKISATYTGSVDCDNRFGADSTCDVASGN